MLKLETGKTWNAARVTFDFTFKLIRIRSSSSGTRLRNPGFTSRRVKWNLSIALKGIFHFEIFLTGIAVGCWRRRFIHAGIKCFRIIQYETFPVEETSNLPLRIICIAILWAKKPREISLQIRLWIITIIFYVYGFLVFIPQQYTTYIPYNIFRCMWFLFEISRHSGHREELSLQ